VVVLVGSGLLYPFPLVLPYQCYFGLRGRELGGENMLNFRLRPLACLLPVLLSTPLQAADKLAALDAVVVTATRQSARVNEVLADVTVLDREDLQNAGAATLTEVLARQPGVEFASNGGLGATNSLYLRGGASSKQVLVLVDGMRVSSATSADFSWSRMPVAQIERIEILRGPASSLYGSDAIGGVVQIFTRQGEGALRMNGEAGFGSYGTRSKSLGFSGRDSGWDYALQVSSLDSTGFNNMTNSRNVVYGDRDGYSSQSFSGRLGYAFNQDNKLALNVFHSAGENAYDSTSATQSTVSRDYRSSIAVDSMQMVSTNRLTENWLSTLRFGRSSDDSRSRTNGNQVSQYTTDQDQLSWQNDFTTKAGSILLAVERLKQRVAVLPTAYTIGQRINNSAVLGWSADFGAHALQTSVRRDDNSQFGGKNTGSLSYGYRFSPEWRSYASLGTAFRAPSMNDLYYPLDGSGFVGNPNLRPETAINREAGLVFLRAGQKVTLTAFSNKISDLITWSGRTSPVNIGHAKLSGGTLAYAGNLAGHDVQASITSQEAIDAETGKRLARRAKEFGSVSVGRQLGAWEFGTEVSAVGRRFDTDANTRALGAYALLNFYGSYTFQPDWSIFARINNVFDKHYEQAADFAVPGVNGFVGVRYSPK
jgi:vitamin B12 transporter